MVKLKVFQRFCVAFLGYFKQSRKMPHMRVPGVTEHRYFKEFLKSLEKWHRNELRLSKNQCTEP